MQVSVLQVTQQTWTVYHRLMYVKETNLSATAQQPAMQSYTGGITTLQDFAMTLKWIEVVTPLSGYLRCLWKWLNQLNVILLALSLLVWLTIPVFQWRVIPMFKLDVSLCMRDLIQIPHLLSKKIKLAVQWGSHQTQNRAPTIHGISETAQVQFTTYCFLVVQLYLSMTFMVICSKKEERISKKIFDNNNHLKIGIILGCLCLSMIAAVYHVPHIKHRHFVCCVQESPKCNKNAWNELNIVQKVDNCWKSSKP